MLEKTKVKDLMTKEVLTVDCDEITVLAFEKLMKHKISAMPVVDDGKMVGIVTATDLGHNLILDNYQYGTKVKSVMVKDVACISKVRSQTSQTPHSYRSLCRFRWQTFLSLCRSCTRLFRD